MNNKQGGCGTDLRTVTYFRLYPGVLVLKWPYTLPLLDVDYLNQVSVETQFEQNFKATPTISFVI
jgi:hypothetical protein